MVTGYTTIHFYHTPFMRGQVDVSSNVERHLSRLTKTSIAVPPFVPRSDFAIPVYTKNPDFSGDVSWYNYAEVWFPDSINGSLTSLYYFVEADMDDPQNTEDTRVMHFYLDPWACYTASASARNVSTPLIHTVGGTVVRGHDTANVQGLSPIVQPPDALAVGSADDIGSREIPLEVVGWDRNAESEYQELIVVAVVEEAIPQQAPALRMFTLSTPINTPDPDGEDIYNSILGITGALYPDTDDIGLYAGRLLNLLSQDLTHKTVEAQPYTFGALSVKRLYLIPRALFDGRVDRNSKQVTSEHDGDEISGVRRLLCLGLGTDPATDRVTFVRAFEMLVPSSPDRVYTWGNTAQHLTFPPSSSERVARAYVLLRPFTGTVGVYLTDGVTEVEISDSLALPLNTIEDAQAKETAGVKDTLAAIAVAGGIVGGIASGNVTSIASGVIGAAGLVADISTRTYAAQRQTIGAAYRNVCANVQNYLRVIGAFRLEVYAPANAKTMRAAYDRYGWDGERPGDVVLIPQTYTYVQYAPGFTPSIAFPGSEDSVPAASRFSYLRAAIANMLENGVRIWNDENSTNYQRYP